VTPPAATGPSSCAHRGLEGSTRAGGPVEVGEVIDAVPLQQIEVVGLLSPERGVDLGSRRAAPAYTRLAGQEDPVAYLRHPQPDTQFHVAIAGGDVDGLILPSRASWIDRSAGPWSTSSRSAAPQISIELSCPSRPSRRCSTNGPHS
jgi:hypothetical protein